MNEFLFIAHRGNIDGPKPDFENNPEYIKQALNRTFYVEIDVWVHGNKILLGHDEGVYPCDISLLENSRVICHAKNFSAVEMFNKNKTIHWFWYENDCCTLTSMGLIWAYPNNLIEGSILNQPEFEQKWNIERAVAKYKDDMNSCSFIGVCSDYVQLLKEEKNV